MVRNGLITFLDSCHDIEAVGQAANGFEAIELCKTLAPDVVLMDLMMPEMDGVTATRSIMQSTPAPRIIALTSFKEDTLIYDAIKAGVVGYLLKDCAVEELAKAIRDAHAGKIIITQEDMQAILYIAEHPKAQEFQLTPRERDVLRMIVQGLSNRQIAYELSLGESTIKFHVSNILAKLKVGTRAEAVAMALQQGLVD